LKVKNETNFEHLFHIIELEGSIYQLEDI
jgi:hypothetical protein